MPINTTLNPDFNNRLHHLADKRNIPIEDLLDKAVELLLEYMESHDTLNEHIKDNNDFAIKKNNEVIKKGREFINKRTES